LPEELLEAVDRVAGKRRRSRFVEAAIREKLSREALAIALREAAGVLRPADYPEWETPEKVSAWVRAGRRADDERLARKLRTQRQ
jgi:predicted transcriptional regulator